MNKFYCCINCFDEPEIIKFIKKAELVGDCDYCGSENISIRPVEEVGEFIKEGFDRYYEDAANSVGYCSQDGGYGLPTHDIHELLIYELMIFGDALDDPYILVEDLVENDHTSYVRQNPYGPPSGEPETIDFWNRFCRLVKHEQRFTALLKTTNDYSSISDHPFDFLRRIISSECQLLISSIFPGQLICRARIDGDWEKKHIELTSPRPDKSTNNRMSPAGISYFYGGMGENATKTCISEVRPSVGDKVVVAEFETLKPITILDLTGDLGGPISVFSDEYGLEYEEFIKPFLKHFANDISKPINANDAAIEYTPTQVFTEFLKVNSFLDIFTDSENESDLIRFDGIKFKSALYKDGENIVIFEGPSISTEDRNDSNALLHYKGYKIYKVTQVDVSFDKSDSH